MRELTPAERDMLKRRRAELQRAYDAMQNAAQALADVQLALTHGGVLRLDEARGVVEAPDGD
jgi:hypothetical protein